MCELLSFLVLLIAFSVAGFWLWLTLDDALDRRARRRAELDLLHGRALRQRLGYDL